MEIFSSKYVLILSYSHLRLGVNKGFKNENWDKNLPTAAADNKSWFFQYAAP